MKNYFEGHSQESTKEGNLKKHYSYDIFCISYQMHKGHKPTDSEKSLLVFQRHDTTRLGGTNALTLVIRYGDVDADAARG